MLFEKLKHAMLARPTVPFHLSSQFPSPLLGNSMFSKPKTLVKSTEANNEHGAEREAMLELPSLG